MVLFRSPGSATTSIVTRYFIPNPIVEILSSLKPYIQVVAHHKPEFTFLAPGDLSDGMIRLRLVETRPADPAKAWVPAYVFHICEAKSGLPVGELQLRVGDTEALRLYGGHIAYGIRPVHRGRHFAARAVRLVAPLALRHQMSEVWITCNPENIASRRTCELAGASFVEIVDLPADIDMYQEGERQKCRYRLDLTH